jgi:hypothetical protein
MPCPYFQPHQPDSTGGGTRSSMLPLGDFWSGHCRAGSAELFQPDPSTQYRLCNLGYARDTCGRFPAGGGPDAVRFHIAGDDGDAILVAWVTERDHFPFAHGSFAWSRQSGDFFRPLVDEHLAGQAFAYVASYRRRKAEAFVR